MTQMVSAERAAALRQVLELEVLELDENLSIGFRFGE